MPVSPPSVARGASSRAPNHIRHCALSLRRRRPGVTLPGRKSRTSQLDRFAVSQSGKRSSRRTAPLLPEAVLRSPGMSASGVVADTASAPNEPADRRPPATTRLFPAPPPAGSIERKTQPRPRKRAPHPPSERAARPTALRSNPTHSTLRGDSAMPELLKTASPLYHSRLRPPYRHPRPKAPPSRRY